MKRTKTNRFFLVVLSFLLVISTSLFLFVGLGAKKSDSYSTSTEDILTELSGSNKFYMLGTSVRLDGNSGLRFTAVGDKDKAESVIGSDTATFNAFIFGVDWMKYYNMDYTTYSAETDYLGFIKARYPYTVSEILDIEPVPKYVDDEIAYYEIRATLSNVLYNNTARDFFGIAYIKDGDEYEYANFDAGNKRNLAYVASATLTEMIYADESLASGDALYNMMQTALYKLTGETASNAADNIEAETYVDYKIELNKTSIELAASETFDLNPQLYYSEDGGDTYTRIANNPLYVKYAITSDANSAISLSGNRITASNTNSGTATVTAYYAVKSGSTYVNATKTISVKVLAEGSATAAKIISEPLKHSNMDVSDFTENDTEINIVTKNDWNNQQDHAVVFKLDGGKGEKKFTLTITNNATSGSKNALNPKIVICSASNLYGDELTIASVSSNATISTGRNSSTDKAAAVNTIAKGESETVVITLVDAVSSDNAYVKVMPQWHNDNYDAGNVITVSNIIIGNGSAGDTDNRYDVEVSTPSNGTLTVDASKSLAGQKVYISATPNAGYSLTSVSVVKEDSTSVSVTGNAYFTMPESDVTVSATFAKRSYTLSAGSTSAKFQISGDDVTVASIGDEITVVSTLSGAVVVGFTYNSMSKKGGYNVNGDTFTMEYDTVTLTSVTVKYPVTVNNGSSNATSDLASAGDTVTITADTPATGKEFTGWTVDAGGVTLASTSNSSTTFTMPSAAVEVTANYDWADYGVTNNVSGDVTVEVNDVEANTAHYGDTITLVPVDGDKLVSSFKYTVDGGDKQTVNTDSMTMPAGDVVITDVSLVDKLVKYSVTVNNGSSDATDDLASAGDTVTITANSPASGYRFNGWTVDEGGVTLASTSATETSFTMGTADVEVTANYVRIYTVTVTNGTASVASAAAGESVTITANSPASGYRFSGWTVGAGGVTLGSTSNSSTSFTMGTANVSVTANYVQIYTVTVTNGTASVASAAAGESVTITANDPASGYTFSGWTVNAGGVTLASTSSSSTTFTMGTSNVSVTAGYSQLVTYATLHSVGKYGNGNSPDSITADSSTSATLHPNMGYGGGGQEAHWQYVEVNGANGKSVITFVVKADQSKTLGVGVLTELTEYAYNNSKFYSVTGVTAGGNAATSYGKGVYTFSATQNTEVTVTITLTDALSTSTALIYVWPYAGGGYQNGSIVVKNFSFATPTSYDITIDSGYTSYATLSSASAYAGATVTLTAQANNKIVTGFTYTSSAGGDTVTGNSFTMPAADVTITSISLGDKPAGANITLTNKYGNSSGASVSGSGTDTFSVSGAQGNDPYHGIGVSIANMSGKSTVTFTINNTGSSTYHCFVWMSTESGNTYAGCTSVSSATNATKANNSGKDGASVEIASGATVTVTLTLSSGINGSGDLRFAFTTGDSGIAYTISNVSVS